jgi:hypothetical protein
MHSTSSGKTSDTAETPQAKQEQQESGSPKSLYWYICSALLEPPVDEFAQGGEKVITIHPSDQDGAQEFHALSQ